MPMLKLCCDPFTVRSVGLCHLCIYIVLHIIAEGLGHATLIPKATTKLSHMYQSLLCVEDMVFLLFASYIAVHTAHSGNTVARLYFCGPCTSW